MIRLARPTTRLAAIAATGVLLLAGCGGGDDAADDPAATTATEVDDAASDDPSATESSPEPSPTESDTESGDSAEDQDDTAGEGASLLAASIDQSQQGTETTRTRVVSTTSTPQGEISVTGEGVTEGTNSDLTMTFGGALAQQLGDGAQDVELTVRLLDGTMYMRFPQLTDQLGANAEWISFDLATLSPQFESILEAAQDADPSSSLDVLREADDVQVVGQEEVAGVPTTHLRVDVALRAALEASGLTEQDISDSGLDPDQVVSYDIWIDDQQRLRRLENSIDVQGTTTETVVEVLEYGVEVSIEAPPADATVSFSELQSAGAGGAGATGGDGDDG